MKRCCSFSLLGLLSLAVAGLIWFSPAQASAVTCAPGTFNATEAQTSLCDHFGDVFAGHSIFLPNLDPNIPEGDTFGDGYRFFFTTADPGLFVENSDCTATLTGSVVSTYHSNLGFRIDIKFLGRTTDPSGGMGPNLELNCGCYVAPFNVQKGGGSCATSGSVDPSTWHFYSGWDSMRATLYGTGDYDGAIVQLTPFMHYFQVGNGASGKNVSLGAAGWFTWHVVHQPKNPAFVLQDSPPITAPNFLAGDININLDQNRPQLGEIGDTVFCDTDRDGVQDNNEPGISNVTVNLFSGNCSGQPIQSQTTDSSGHYLFTSLPVGNYCVQVDQSSLPPGSCNVPRCQTSYSISLGEGQNFLDADFCFTNGCNCPTTQGFPSLGSSSKYTVFALRGPAVTKQTANFSNVTVTGDVAIAKNVTLKHMAPSSILGNLYVENGGTWSGPGKITGTVFNNQNLTTARNDALSASAAAAALSPNFTYANVNSNKVINGVAGLNVVKITGNVNLSNASLTLSGPSNAFFVVNITGSVTLVGSGGIVIGGSVPQTNLLINMTGDGANLINTHVGNVIQGTLLGPNVGGQLDGAFGSLILGRDFSLMSGAVVKFGGCACP